MVELEPIPGDGLRFGSHTTARGTEPLGLVVGRGRTESPPEQVQEKRHYSNLQTPPPPRSIPRLSVTLWDGEMLLPGCPLSPEFPLAVLKEGQQLKVPHFWRDRLKGSYRLESGLERQR